MIGALWWMLQHWWLVIWAAAVAIAWRYGGWRLALAVGTLGLGSSIYAKGRQHGRDEVERRDQKRRDYLKEHYDEIDSRPRDPDNAFERLHKRARDE
ncbi:hypothetical protein O9Z70_13535 [Devosia sp. YIM 151766]|uniref:hypothetical protein n=1 Tax=Devosia sp. YIM 151766 TaxID=3017325 RepID=UPI00255CC715|nr:hypothetical protein [Devosia sp. YIM 151766]WIY52471.1 hypothetical protein O9Z70_13535 [Devosia sp. YIM 151766]